VTLPDEEAWGEHLKRLLAEIEETYLADDNLKPAWPVEQDSIADLLQRIADKISFNFTIDGLLGVGGSGIVLSVLDRNLHAKRALKMPRPSPGKEQLLATVLEKETDSLLRLSHPNLIRVFAQGAVSRETEIFPYYVMDFVPGVKDADEYLRGDVSERDVLNVFRGVLRAVAYMHSQQKIHMDLKPGNVLVSPDCVPIISDLGFAKDLRTEEGYTVIGGTEGFIHPDARAFVHEASSDPNRRRGKALRSSLKATWDCFSLGKTFLRLLKELDEHNPKVLTPYTHRFLMLLSCRLLDGKNVDSELALGLSIQTMREIKYENVEQALLDLEKVSGEYNLDARIPELNIYGENTVQASSTSVTSFTPRVRSLLADANMAALGTVSQLGLLNLVYPTATHTRLEHSLGTYSVLVRYISALYHDPLNPLFCQIMDEDDLRSALVAALVHDIGQYPLAHDLEEAHPHVFSHTERGVALLEDKDSSARKAIEAEDGWNVEVDRVVSILSADPRELVGSLKDRILHSLIDGPIDADKIDYIVRDSQNLGLEYGRGLSFERLLRTLTIVSKDEGGRTYAGLGIHEKGKVPAEAVAFARYALYGQVYWQHTYRSVKAKLQRMAWEILERAAKGDTTRKAGPEKKVREDLYAFLDTVNLTEPQEELFKSAESWPHAGQIQPADSAMLRWLAQNSGEVGEKLYEHIRSRKLFKRMLVLSYARGGSFWDEVFNLYGHGRPRSVWGQKLSFQRNFQDHVREAVANAEGPDVETSVITDDARNSFLAEAESSVVLLVDFPVEQSKKEGQLEYVMEEDRRRSKANDMQVGNLEESVVWKSLRQNFHYSIGKLRVFCDPTHAEFLSAYLSREEMEAALRMALKKSLS
jgi:HD superfamily phosphohydrolase